MAPDTDAGGRGVGSLAEWSAKAATMAERLRCDLAEALLMEAGASGFRAAARVLVDLSRSGKSPRTRLRAADLLLRHAEKAGGVGGGPVIQNAVAVNVQNQVNVERAPLDFSSLLPDERPPEEATK